MKRLIPFFLVVVTLAASLAVSPASAQTPPVEVEVDANPPRVTVGDRIALTVIVRHEEGLLPDLPSPGDAFGELEVLEVAPPGQRTLEDGRIETRLTFVVAAFRTGQIQLPPLQVPYADAAGNRGVAYSQALPITVESVIPAGEGPQDIRDLKPQLSIPGGEPFWVGPLVAAGAVAGAALLALLAWRWVSLRLLEARRRARGPLTLPEVAARRELDRLALRELVPRGAYKDHYRLLSGCLRRYVSDRYGFPAFAFTTIELERQMTGRGVDRWQARLIAALLRECDQVQFGQYRPAAARAEGDLTTAYEILELTGPEREEEPALA